MSNNEIVKLSHKIVSHKQKKPTARQKKNQDFLRPGYQKYIQRLRLQVGGARVRGGGRGAGVPADAAVRGDLRAGRAVGGVPVLQASALGALRVRELHRQSGVEGGDLRRVHAPPRDRVAGQPERDGG